MDKEKEIEELGKTIIKLYMQPNQHFSLSEELIKLGYSKQDKETAMEVTHEATLYEALTCPRCHNVVNKRETWGDSEINMIPNYCPFCGQHLKKESK